MLSLEFCNIFLKNSKFNGATLPQNALRRDCNGKCIEIIEGHYLEVVVLLYFYSVIKSVCN